MQSTNRIYGLDTLRSVAIILVFMSHYTLLTGLSTFGILGNGGGVGVDLFFALSGYLIGHQIFSALATHEPFSLKIFYCRRFLRTFPNYFFVLALYFLIPGFREKPLTTPLWKFITFTQNFGFSPSAFSHAWSLCIEEQFYFILPLIALLIAYKGSIKTAWILIITILVAETIIRGSIWHIYLQHAGLDIGRIYTAKIYYPTYSRLDGLVIGVSVAMLKSFHKNLWNKLTSHGNLLLICGLAGYCFIFYIFQHGTRFFPTTFGYSILAISSSTLTLGALSPGSILHRFKIPGAKTLALWSYAIYLTHKQFIHLTQIAISHWTIGKYNFISLAIMILVSLIGGWLLYTLVETPFLKLRDRIGKINPILEPNNPENIFPATEQH